MSFPPWVILHVPHDSTEIPGAIRDQFIVDDQQLATEVIRMTDHHTLMLFASPNSAAQVVRAPVSRLVVDVERFPKDDDEPMAARGMGAVYAVTSDLRPLRRTLSDGERNELLRSYYHPHHDRLEAAASAAIAAHGQALVIDCHCFPATVLPYELTDATQARPDICIGTDAFHTSDNVATAFVDAFRGAGWRVAVNSPFAGALVVAVTFAPTLSDAKQSSSLAGSHPSRAWSVYSSTGSHSTAVPRVRRDTNGKSEGQVGVVGNRSCRDA